MVGGFGAVLPGNFQQIPRVDGRIEVDERTMPAVPPPDLIPFELVCRNCWSSSIVFGTAASYSATWVFGAIASWPMTSRFFAAISVPTQAATSTASKGSPRLQLGPAVSSFPVRSKRPRRLPLLRKASQPEMPHLT